MDGHFAGKQVGHYLLSSVLGAGAAGCVYQAVDVTSEGSPAFAVKCIQESPISRRRLLQMVEIENHNAVVHCPQVMTLCDVFEEDRYWFLVLPLCEADMFCAIWRRRVYWRNDDLIRKVFIEILDGVFACHQEGVFHRDLKPENIMCNSDGTRIQIGDFGLSTNRRLCRDAGCGTAAYMSPECLDGGGIFYYSDRADIWSLGVILFNMVTCRYPWEEAHPTDKRYKAFRSKRDYLSCTSPISEPLSKLLCRIWDPSPMERMSIPTIRKVIEEMDTFYSPPRPSHSPSPLSKEVGSVDSQQTCVAPAEEEKMKGTDAPAAISKKLRVSSL